MNKTKKVTTKTKETTNPNSSLKSDTKSNTKRPYKYFDEYSDLYTGRLVPVPETFLERLGQELLRWSEEEGKDYQLKITQFLRKKGIPRKTYYQWIERSPILKNYHEEALQALGDKRESKAFNGEGNVPITMFTMPHYDPDWKVLAEWRSKMAKDEGQATGNITIHMETAPSSSLVPEK